MKNKFKNKKALAKRVVINKNNTWKRKSAFKSHLAKSKTKKQKLHLSKAKLFHDSDIKRLKRAISNKGLS